MPEGIGSHYEEWRPVVGYEGFYEVSDKGRVRSLDRKVWNGRCFYLKKARVLRCSKTTTGYWKVELVKEKSKKSLKVHRLVAFAFLPIEEGRCLVNHKDGNPLNNDVSNLEWCTQSENMKHACENQLIPNNFHAYKKQILDEYKTTEINIRKLASKYNCSQKSISDYLKKEGITLKPYYMVSGVYKIDKKRLIELFQLGLKDKEIANEFSANRRLIAVYRNKYKKGELKA